VDANLYGPDGNFKFRGRQLGVCALCAAKDYVYDVGALGPNTRFCRGCIKKNGPVNLRRDANVALQRAISAHKSATVEIREMTKRYRARFNHDVDWKIPAVVKE
jgi:hypothetical protein